MNWLEKVAKPITMEQTIDDIAAALNYIADKCNWTLARVGDLNREKLNTPTESPQNEWYSLIYAGMRKIGGNGISADFYLNVTFRWAGEPGEHYDNMVGSSKLEFTAQLHGEDDEPITEEIGFETSTEIANFVKQNMDDDEFKVTNNPVTPDPSTFVPGPAPSPSLEPVPVGV